MKKRTYDRLEVEITCTKVQIDFGNIICFFFLLSFGICKQDEADVTVFYELFCYEWHKL